MRLVISFAVFLGLLCSFHCVSADGVKANKKNINAGNIDLVNAFDNGIMSYIVATDKDANLASEYDYYTCEISAVKNVQFLDIVDNGTFAFIIKTGKIKVGIGNDGDNCDLYAGENEGPCGAFLHSLEYINNTYRHVKSDLNIKPEYIIVSSDTDPQEALADGKIDIYISQFMLKDDILLKGLLMSCSYSNKNSMGTENEYIYNAVFLFRKDKDINSNGDVTVLGNDMLIDVFNAGFVDWKTNDPVGIDIDLGKPRRSYKKLITDIYGYYGPEFDRLRVAKSSYPLISISETSTAFKNILYSHYIMVWMPGFYDREDGYVGVNSTSGLEKTVLKEVFYKVGEYYGRRIDIVYYKSDDFNGMSTYNQIKEFQTNPKLTNISILMDKIVPMNEYYKYVQFGAEFFTNTIVPVFNSKAFCYEGNIEKGMCKSSNETRNKLSSENPPSLGEILDMAKSICINNGKRGTVNRFVEKSFDLTNKTIISRETTAELFASTNQRECDLALMDFGAAQFYFYNHTNITFGYDVFQISTTLNKTSGKFELLNSFSFDFQFAPAFKKDKNNAEWQNLNDNVSTNMAWGSLALIILALGLAISSVFIPRGIGMRCIDKIKERQNDKKSHSSFKPSNLLVEPTYIASKTGAGNTAGPAIDNDW